MEIKKEENKKAAAASADPSLKSLFIFVMCTCEQKSLTEKKKASRGGGGCISCNAVSGQTTWPHRYGVAVFYSQRIHKTAQHHNRITLTIDAQIRCISCFFPLLWFFHSWLETVLTIFHRMKSVTVKKATVERFDYGPFSIRLYIKYAMPVND